MAQAPTVDQDVCISCGLCVGACPQVFRMNSHGKAFCFNPQGADKINIQAAIDGCPVQAISWTD